jgi:hypothetical protein
MEINGNPHVSGAYPRNVTRYPLRRRMGESESLSGHAGEQKMFLLSIVIPAT